MKIPPQGGGSEPKNLNSLGTSSTEPPMGYPLLETERTPSKIVCGFFISEFCGFFISEFCGFPEKFGGVFFAPKVL